MRTALAITLLSAICVATPARATTKLVVVRAQDWSSNSGTLQRFERAGDEASWRSVAAPREVELGRNGLGWGRGDFSVADAVRAAQGPLKREGDGRTPAGIFRIVSAMGYDAPAHPPKTQLPYTRATSSWKCVDDPRSKYYNQLVDEEAVAKDWSSAEDMKRDDNLYARVLVVGHNVSVREPGHGSCIFIHLRRGIDTPTAGCMAMESGAVETLMSWADAETKLVVLPDAAYRALAKSWGLPLESLN